MGTLSALNMITLPPRSPTARNFPVGSKAMADKRSFFVICFGSLSPKLCTFVIETFWGGCTRFVAVFCEMGERDLEWVVVAANGMFLIFK